MALNKKSDRERGSKRKLAGANHQRERRGLGRLGRLLTNAANQKKETDTFAEVLTDTVATYSGRHNLML